jgi:hypothetical protein
MLNDLLYSISPRNRPASEHDYMGSGMSREAWLKDRDEKAAAKAKAAQGPAWEQDPWGAMQGITERNAYVNETLGGGFYGGVIPDSSMNQTWGGPETQHRPDLGGDPHFPAPPKDNPWTIQSANDATSQYDAYPGWATTPGQSAFGVSPWGSLNSGYTWQPPQGAPAWGNTQTSYGDSPWNSGNKGPWG